MASRLLSPSNELSAQERASYRYCAQLSRRAAGNFYYGFRLLPRPRKRAMCALYAFLRHSDDIVDDPRAAVDEKRARLEAWRAELDAALAHSSLETAQPSPILPALAHAAHAYEIPVRHLHDALDGVAMDLEPRGFETFDDLYQYCYRVASTAGLCCLSIWGVLGDRDEAERMAEWCGIAFQITNIIRDIREDALQGRVYLPREDLERFDVDPARLVEARIDDRLRELLAFECDRAESYYQRAAGLEALVAPAGRPMLRAMVGIYRGLLNAIRDARYDVFSRRVSLSAMRKASIALRALAAGARAGARARL